MTFFVKSAPDMQAESGQTMPGGREWGATGYRVSEWQDGRKSALAGFVLYTAYNGDTANIRQINLTMLSHSLTTHTTRFTMNYVQWTMHVQTYAPVYQVIFIPVTVPVNCTNSFTVVTLNTLEHVFDEINRQNSTFLISSHWHLVFMKGWVSGYICLLQ